MPRTKAGRVKEGYAAADKKECSICGEYFSIIKGGHARHFEACRRKQELIQRSLREQEAREGISQYMRINQHFYYYFNNQYTAKQRALSDALESLLINPPGEAVAAQMPLPPQPLVDPATLLEREPQHTPENFQQSTVQSK
jgi:hypothetical protein